MQIFLEAHGHQTDEPDAQVVQDYINRENVAKTRTQRILGMVWDSFGKDPETRAFVNRLDAILLLYSMYAYFIKYLDQANVSNAYVSGMQVDLHMVGQDRNYMNLMYSMGYMVGSGLGMVIMTKVRPSYYLCLCEFLWTACTLGLIGVNNTSTLYGLRFVTGLASSAAYPGLMWVLSSWYSHDELAKRLCLVGASSYIGVMCSGYFAAAVYTNLNGNGGLAGWRWLFLVEGVIGIPMCLLCLYCVPDAPSNTRALWLKPKHREFGIMRAKAMGRAEPTGMTVKRFLSIFAKWQFWCYIVEYLMFSWTYTAVGYMNLWLQSLHYSVADINNIPTAGTAWAFVCAYFLSLLSDQTGSRALSIYISAVIGLIGMIMLSVWNIPLAALMFAMIFPFGGDAGGTLVVTWLQESMQEDHEIRGIMLGLGNTVSYAFSSWMPVLLFPTPDAPHYKFGYQVQCAFYGISIIVTTLWLFLIRRSLNKGEYNVNGLGLMEKVKPELSEGVSRSPEVTTLRESPEPKAYS